ncbi:MAG: hypothetical protein GY909_09985 [Oligoflexia bacterium]|nr:hypothetical protein [Oligoflexia bacterium]
MSVKLREGQSDKTKSERLQRYVYLDGFWDSGVRTAYDENSYVIGGNPKNMFYKQMITRKAITWIGNRKFYSCMSFDTVVKISYDDFLNNERIKYYDLTSLNHSGIVSYKVINPNRNRFEKLERFLYKNNLVIPVASMNGKELITRVYGSDYNLFIKLILEGKEVSSFIKYRDNRKNIFWDKYKKK